MALDLNLDENADFKSIPILVTGESSPERIRSNSISTVSTELEDDAIFRKRWKSTYGFLLACIHLSLGLGNVWRFPYIAYRHGSFVIAYIILNVVVIVPIFFLEVSLGQFSSRGPLAIWVICPSMKGVGYAMLIISTLASMYFNMISSYSILYTFASLQEKLPWEDCYNWWNTEDCASVRFVRAIDSNISLVDFQQSVLNNDVALYSTAYHTSIRPLNRTLEYFARKQQKKNPSNKKYVYDYYGHPADLVTQEGFLANCIPSYLPVLPDSALFNHSLSSNISRNGTMIAPSSKLNRRHFFTRTGLKKSHIRNLVLNMTLFNRTRVKQHGISLWNVSYNGTVYGGYSQDPILSTEEYMKVFMGNVQGSEYKLSWQLALGSLFIWIIVFLMLIKGHKFSGKVAYVACLYPFILFIVIMIRVQALTGSRPGIIKFFVPDRRILSAEVWHDAAVQCFFSNFVGWGPIIMMASHNSFFNNLLRDVLIVPCVNVLAALIVGIISFGMVAYVSLNTCIPFDEVAPKDPSFIFAMYPIISTTFPISPLWGFLVFATITQLGINSQIFCVKTLITSIMDERIPHFQKPLRIIFCTSIVLFLTGLVFASKFGIQFIEFIDFESTAWSLIVIGILECIIVAWIYGANHLLLDIRIILRHPLRPIWYIFWSYITPLVLLIILIVSILDNRDLIVIRGTQFSKFVNIAAWILSILPILIIIFYFIYYFLTIEPSLFQGYNQDNSKLIKSTPKTKHNYKHWCQTWFQRISACLQNAVCCGKKFVGGKSTRSLNSNSIHPLPPNNVVGNKTRRNLSQNRSSLHGDIILESVAKLKNENYAKVVKGQQSHHHAHFLNDDDSTTDANNTTELDQLTTNKPSSKLFFNKSRNRLGTKKEPTNLLTKTKFEMLKERLIKCISPTSQWGPYTENHQLLQQIAFRIQRSNHQILNKAVHKKAREIIDLVNQSGSTSLSIKDLLFINPNAPTGKSGDKLKNIEDVGAIKIKPSRKYSLFDGYKEVVFMELPKDMMTKIDEPGVYTFLQPLDIDIPSNMILLPNIYSNFAAETLAEHKSPTSSTLPLVNNQSESVLPRNRRYPNFYPSRETVDDLSVKRNDIIPQQRYYKVSEPGIRYMGPSQSNYSNNELPNNRKSRKVSNANVLEPTPSHMMQNFVFGRPINDPFENENLYETPQAMANSRRRTLFESGFSDGTLSNMAIPEMKHRFTLASIKSPLRHRDSIQQRFSFPSSVNEENTGDSPMNMENDKNNANVTGDDPLEYDLSNEDYNLAKRDYQRFERTEPKTPI